MFRLQSMAQQLRQAIAARRTAELQRLLQVHGLVAFSSALAVWSPRVVADALSQLPEASRGSVLRHLPRGLREEVQRSGIAASSGVAQLVASGALCSALAACNFTSFLTPAQAAQSALPTAIDRQGGVLNTPRQRRCV